MLVEKICTKIQREQKLFEIDFLLEKFFDCFTRSDWSKNSDALTAWRNFMVRWMWVNRCWVIESSVKTVKPTIKNLKKLIEPWWKFVNRLSNLFKKCEIIKYIYWRQEFSINSYTLFLFIIFKKLLDICIFFQNFLNFATFMTKKKFESSNSLKKILRS